MALSMASAGGPRRAFIATMKPMDPEMNERAESHRMERGPGWDTFVEPLELPALIRRLDSGYDSTLVDCLTLWLSNLMLSGREPLKETEGLLSALRDGKGDYYIVSNEVGMGIVPENDLARRFRDMAGRMNQAVSAMAHEVYLAVSGIPMRIKPQK